MNSQDKLESQLNAGGLDLKPGAIEEMETYESV